MLVPQNIIDWLKLQPNTDEGGFFAGTYTSVIKIPNEVLPGFIPVKDGRSLCSAIYYFLDSGSFSVLHKTTGDMVYSFYSGDPVQMLLLYPPSYPNRYELCTFSNDIAAGVSPMKIIPGGTWLGSRLAPGGTYALMAPGFDPNDYTIGNRNDLMTAYPEAAGMIPDFTRK